jgi:hypothetical protein
VVVVEGAGAKKKAEAFSIGPVKVVSHLNPETAFMTLSGQSVGALLFSIGKISPFKRDIDRQ